MNGAPYAGVTMFEERAQRHGEGHNAVDPTSECERDIARYRL